LAAALHFDRNDQVRIATAVSEIARNAFRYGSEAKAEFWVCRSKTGDDSRSVSSFVAVISDQGPGIDNLPSILAGTYKSRTGAGTGIRGAKRLMGAVHVDTGATGTTVRLEQRLPKGVDFKPSDLHSIIGKPIRSGKGELLEDLGAQNQAFMAALDRLSTQDIELEKINEGLSETNRCVVALYDELDTVQRVGRVIASKLDLGSLVQAITDATVEVSGAECGGFFRKDPRSKNFSCQTVSGPLGIALENCFLTN